MKKITLLLFTIVLSSVSFSQVVLSEDFEAGLSLPAGWTNNDIAGGGEVWTFSDSVETPSAFTTPNTYMTSAGMIGNYAIFDSDGYGGSIAENAALESPVFDCSSLTSITLSYDHFFTEGYAGEGHVEVFNGTTWVEVATYNTTTVTDYDLGYIELDVSTELAGVTNAQVRFRWVGDYSWWWAVDNVSVYQCTVTAPNQATVVAPLDGAIDVPITYGVDNSVGPFEWADAATGDPASSYNINLGITAAGNDIGTIAGFASGGTILYDFQPGTTYYWSVDAVNCAGVTAGTVWSFTTTACTETVAPTAATTPVPADASTGVILAGPNGSLTFNWTAANPNDFFTLNIGTANPPTQAFDDFENGGTITGLAVSTTYYWSVDVVNCFGTTTGPVWSFTTDAALSVDDNTLETFKVYPNPTSDVLNIKHTQDIDNITVYNLIGQDMMSFSKNDIIDSAINISDLPKGLYLIKISSGEKSETLKITKK